ncbi:MAG: DUF6904 family protein [Bacilli bacterium]
MIHVRSTPHDAGVEVLGDYLDLDGLYLSLHTVVGDEGEFGHYEGARLRVLGVCYDLRHALMGDRNVEFVENGLDADKIKRLAVIAQEKNLYYKIQVLWPEVLFVVMALNDFLWLHAKKLSKEKFTPLMDRRSVWDPDIAHVRMFQSAVAKCVKDTVSEAAFPRIMNQINKGYPWLDGYITQYVDRLNLRFLDLETDQRRKSISTMAKRLGERGEEYRILERDVTAAARHHNCSVDDISSGLDYPEDIAW